jgi:hypothetical protein
MNYKQCECCGNYFLETPENNDKIYCSTECETTFVRCVICNNYYPYEEGMDINNYMCCENFAVNYKLDKESNKQKHNLSGLIIS